MATMMYGWIFYDGDDLGESKLHRAMQRPQGPKWINKPQHSGAAAADELHHKEGNNTPSSNTSLSQNERCCQSDPAQRNPTSSGAAPPLSAHECECAAQGTFAAATAHATHKSPIASPLNCRCSLQFAIWARPDRVLANPSLLLGISLMVNSSLDAVGHPRVGSWFLAWTYALNVLSCLAIMQTLADRVHSADTSLESASRRTSPRNSVGCKDIVCLVHDPA